MAIPVISQEVLPPLLGSNSEPPHDLFKGTTRLYTTYYCPFAQRAWIARNFKGLQDQIQLVPIDLDDRPVWYKEKVYPENKVPALEHNGKIIGESLDLISYIDSHFKGPSLFPYEKDEAKKQFTEELFTYCNVWNPTLFFYLKGMKSDDEMKACFDQLEKHLSKYKEEGPFLLGANFTAVDVAYAPFVQRYHPLFLDLHKYEITAGRPNLAAWLLALDTVESFRQTKWDADQNIKIYKRRNLGIV